MQSMNILHFADEICNSEITIQWKKQISTIAFKKGLTPVDFLNQKILATNQFSGHAEIIAYFDFIEDISNKKAGAKKSKNTKIYLIYVEREKIVRDLYYNIHIPSKKNIKIVNNAPKYVKGCSKFLRFYGDIYALCMDINTFYLEFVDVEQYIDIVQAEQEHDEEDAEEIDDTEQDAEEVDAEDAADDDCADDGDADDGDDDEDDDADVDAADEDDIDAEEDDDTEDDAIDNDIDDEEDDADDPVVDLEDDDAKNVDCLTGEDGNGNDADDVDGVDGIDGIGDNTDAEDENTVVETDIIDEEDNAIDNDIDNDINDINDAVDILPEIEKPATKKKKSSYNKNLKVNCADFSVIFNILKEEPKIISEHELHPNRIKCITLLKTLPLNVNIIKLIEHGIYNYAINKCNEKTFIPLWENMEFLEIYISKTKNLFSNLKPNSYVNNLSLIEKITNGAIKPEELAQLDTYKLYPEIWQDMLEEKTKIEKILKDSLKESATDMFICPKCYKRKTIYCEVQTRSSDEPMTKFITCLECGNKWKKY